MFGMVHHRQRLPLGLEPGDDLPVSMPGLMILSATLRRTGCSCSAMQTDAHAPLADLLEQLVGADHACRGALRSPGCIDRRTMGRGEVEGRPIQELPAAASAARRASTYRGSRVRRASFVEICGASPGVGSSIASVKIERTSAGAA